MDYNDNDFRSQNLHLVGEGNNKFPPVLRPYALSRFDFDDNLHGQLRFDSLPETEVLLGIESSEGNQWIEDFSRGSTGIAFSSSAAEPCSISRPNNVWSEAASSESVEMLLKSVGQDETIPGQIISKDSDACDELGSIIKQMQPSLKHGDSGLSKAGVGLQPGLQTSEIPGKFSGFKGDVTGDHQLVEDVCQTHEFDEALKAPNSRNSELPESERDKPKNDEQVAVNESQVEASVDQYVGNREQEHKFASGSEVDTVIPSVKNTCASSALLESQDVTHLKNDISYENVDSLARENVDLSQEVHIDCENLIENAVESVTLLAHKHSALDMQSKEDGYGVGNVAATAGEPFDRILKENSDLHMVEGCSEGLGVETPLQTGISKDIVLSEGKYRDISSMPFVGDSTLKEHESEVSNTDTRISTSLESKLDTMVQIACDTVEKKDLSESDCHPDTKILSSNSEKYLLLVEDGEGSKGEGEGEGAYNTLGAEPMRICEEFVVTEHNDDLKCNQSVSTAAKQNTKLLSNCSNTDCGMDGSPLVKKGVDSSSFGTDDIANELASNLQADVANSGSSVDCVLLPSGKSVRSAAVFDQKEVQVSSPEASFSIMKTSGIATENGAPCATVGQSSCKKVGQSLSMEDTSNAEGQSGDQTLNRVSLEVVKDMHASSITSHSIVRETDGVISKSGFSEAAGAVSIQENKTSTNSVPPTSKEPSHNAGQNHPEDGDPKLVSKEISGYVAVHHVDADHGKIHNGTSPSAPSSESQTKIHMMECGRSTADLDNASCDSPIVIRTSEQSQSKVGMHGVKESKNQSASVSGVINGEANKEQSISQDAKGNDATSGDRTFTFEVPRLADLSEKEAGKKWQSFSTMQHDQISSVFVGTPSTSGLSKVGAKAAQEVSRANLQASETENVRGGSKGTSERRTRRAGSKSTVKEAAKKGIAAKDTTSARQSERSGRTSNAPLGRAGIGQLVQSNEMQHYGLMEGFHQPFTDLQQVQLRAQIFVYGALIQGAAPDEAYMISAFGGTDGGRTIWENAWRACMDRVYCQKSYLVSPETPLQTRIGAKISDQSIEQNAHQSKVTPLPASQSNSKGTPTTFVNPMIPLSSPLWSIPRPSGDALQPTSIPRGVVTDYQQALSPLHPPPIRNFVGHNAPWMSQSPFHGPWVPQTSAFDGSARFPVLPITETVNLTPVREASVPHSSVMKQVSTVPVVQSGSPANIFAGTPLLDNKKVTVTPGQSSADPKPRKRKKSTVSEDPGQIIPHSQTESLLANVVNSHASTPAAITSPAAIVSKSSTDKFVTSFSADHLRKGNRDSDQRPTLSEVTIGKLKEAQKQAEDAAALAAAAVSHSQDIWNQLDKHKNSGLALDFKTELTSAAVAVAAAAAVAKAAAAAANVASNAALQAKLMADEALISSGCRNSIPAIAISYDSAKKLGKASPVSILRVEEATTSSNSDIVSAREASRRRIEAASAASKRAENMDSVVKAAELAAEAVSQAGKIVVMGESFPLTELVEAGPEAYWKLPQASPEPDGSIREHIDKGGSVEGPGSFARLPKEVPVDKREKQSDNHEMSPILREMARESMQDRSGLIDGTLGPAATSRKYKKGQKGHKASDTAKTKGITSESGIEFGSPSMTTQAGHGKAGETSKDNSLREGSHVEVSRDGGGLKVAWFLADILDLKDGKAYVCYNELKSEDGDRLKEWVELGDEGDRAPRIRSARPITAMPFEGTRKRRRAAMGNYNWSVGDRVDAWMQDSWWEGIVNEKSKKDETSFTVHFPAQGETSVVNASLLRPSLTWKNGNWVEWSGSQDNNGYSHKGDTPQEKRPRIGSPVIEAKGTGELSISFDSKESGKPDDTRLLDFYASEKIFNIGRSSRDDSMPGSLRMIRSGLKKEGSRVIFGVPKPGKKRKFMEVSKHYVADQGSRTHETSDSSKFTKYLMPQGSEPPGTKNKIEPKEKRMAVSKPKVLKPSIPQKDGLSSSVVSEHDDAEAADESKFKDSVSHDENISGKHNLVEFRSLSSSDGAEEGPVLFSSVALSPDAAPKKTSTSNAKSERISKGKLAPAAGKLAKVEEEKVSDGNSMKTVSEVVEPRRSNRRIQPTSRLLEGLQSSLIISKIPVSHDKGHKTQSRSTKGNNQG